MAVLLAATLAVYLAVLAFRQPLPLPHPAEREAAAAQAARAQAVLGPRITGPEYTWITTTLAPHQVKLLSLHPDFAALAAGWLKKAGAGPGSRVAVNLSGSFPALNIAVLSAIRAVGAEPVIISSVGASTWGATDPEFTWLDMERTLNAAGVWTWRSEAASVGGVGDKGGGLTPEGRLLAEAAIRRSGAVLMVPGSLREAIDLRLERYRGPDGTLPAVLVNVGGGHVIFGGSGHRSPLPQGLNLGYHPLFSTHDGLAAAFLQSNRPVIHLLNVGQLAAQYGIYPWTPAGGSGAFLSRQPPLPLRVLTGLWLAGVLTVLWKGRPQKEL